MANNVDLNELKDAIEDWIHRLSETIKIAIGLLEMRGATMLDTTREAAFLIEIAAKNVQFSIESVMLTVKENTAVLKDNNRMLKIIVARSESPDKMIQPVTKTRKFFSRG